MSSSDRKGLLLEMFRLAKTEDSCKVFIMDKVTVKIMSGACTIADIANGDTGVTVMEDMYKRRHPFPFMDAIYFIQPTKDNVMLLLSDMAGKAPFYRKAFVFFSSPISKDLLGLIKEDSTVLPRLGTLREAETCELLILDRSVDQVFRYMLSIPSTV